MKRRYYVAVRPDRFTRDFNSVSHVLHHKPSTWSKYKNDPHEFKQIIDMEIAELHSCESSGNYHCYIENLLHVAAACLYAHHNMTCKDPD